MLQPLTREQIEAVHRKIADALRTTDDEMLAETSISGKLRLARQRHPRAGGIVYFIQCGEFIKIGYTGRDDVIARGNELSANNPYPLHILHTTPGPVALEREFHRALRHIQHRGEWFHFDAEFDAALIDLDDNHLGS